MRYNEEDELERMRSRRSRRREASYEDDYEDYDDFPDEDLEEVYIDDRSSGRGGRPARRTNQQAFRTDSVRDYEYRQTSRQTGSQRGTGRPPRRGQEPSASRQGRARAGQESGHPIRQKKVRRRKGSKALKSILLLALVCVIGFTAWSFLHRPTGVWTIAVFGVDSRDGGTDRALADVQMICAVDRETGEIKLTSVYRDTYLKIDSEGTYHKINEAYFRGGHEQAVAALEENLDLKIDNYATFNWKAVAQAINVLGGVDLEITDAEFTYINAFITETVNSTGIGSVQLEQAGMQHLDGVQAVAYSRLRLMDTDFQRTERQRKVVSLALEKAKAADAGTLTQLVSAILPQISTDIGIDDLLPMARNISAYHLGETAGFPFSRQTERIGRMDCVIPTTLESNVSQLHLFLYGEENYQPSSAVRAISEKVSQDSGLYEVGTPAPTGGSGGSSGGSSSGGASPAPEPQAPAETVPETISETTIEETTAQETTEAAEETTEAQEEDETEEREQETEEEREPEGPGSVNPSRDETEAQTERPSAEEKEPEGPSETHGFIAPNGPGSLPTEPEIGPGV